jgi:hypothetical protein
VISGACEGDCYFIKVGGWQGEVGSGEVNITLVSPADCDVLCAAACEPALADNRFNVNGLIKNCTTDAYCRAGAGAPMPQTVCRSGQCYVMRNRYLSVRPNPLNADAAAAYRIKLDDGDGVFEISDVTLGWAQDPTNVNTAGPGPTVWNLSRIGDAPFYIIPSVDLTSNPKTMTIGDCEIRPGDAQHGEAPFLYWVQCIKQGDNTADEGNYSTALGLPTPTRSLDVTGGGAPGNPPNGAQTSLVDAFAVVLGFQNLQNEPKDWLDVEPQVPNLIVNLADAFLVVQAFQLQPYPFMDPIPCPGGP